MQEYKDADSLHLPEEENGFSLQTDEQTESSLAGLIGAAYQEAQIARDHDEQRWIQAYHNYRGVYPKKVRFRKSEKSRVFVKITKTKVLAAFGQLAEVVFGAGKFPITVRETRIPEGIPEYAHVNTSVTPDIETSIKKPDEPKEAEVENPYDVGYEGDGKELIPGAVYSEQKGLFKKLQEAGVEPEAGPATSPTDIQISPAKEAARRMEKLIHDQIEESNGTSELGSAMFEATLFGTGIVKGPFNFNKTIHRWETDKETGERTYTPLTIRVPRIEFVSCWDFFPDPAATSLEECEYVIHRHRLNISQLRALKNMPHFKNAELRKAIQFGPSYLEQEYEQELRDNQRSQDVGYSKFEVLEYWGILDNATCLDYKIDIGADADPLEETQVNIWVCNGQVIRAVKNPFSPGRIPYNAFPYERNPYSFFGVGVAENMDDSQQIMNGHARMAIDNLALAGSMVLDVDTSMLEHGQSYDIYPGKVFKRQSGLPGQAIHGIKFPNTAPENMMMFDKFRQLADEQTGIPSYSHGVTGIQSTTRTAAGMSMLMGAASQNIKTVVKNLDDFLLRPIGNQYFQWNMQFFEGPIDIRGDLEIRAMGTSSLMQKEVRSQRLTTFLQSTANPALAPYAKIPKIMEELAISLELDPSEVVNSEEEAKVAAYIIGLQNNANNRPKNGESAGPAGQPPAGLDSPSGLPQGPNSQGPTGNGDGTIGTGPAPVAGEAEFSGLPPQA